MPSEEKKFPVKPFAVAGNIASCSHYAQLTIIVVECEDAQKVDNEGHRTAQEKEQKKKGKEEREWLGLGDDKVGENAVEAEFHASTCATTA